MNGTLIREDLMSGILTSSLQFAAHPHFCFLGQQNDSSSSFSPVGLNCSFVCDCFRFLPPLFVGRLKSFEFPILFSLPACFLVEPPSCLVNEGPHFCIFRFCSSSVRGLFVSNLDSRILGILTKSVGPFTFLPNCQVCKQLFCLVMLLMSSETFLLFSLF